MNKTLKITFSLLLMLVIVCSAITLMACGMTECKHEWSEWSVTTNPTCDVDGVETRVCSIDASHKETRPIAKLGHVFTSYTENDNATCELNATKTATCDREGCSGVDSIDIPNTKLGHLFTSYVSDENADCVTNCTETATCDREGCMASQTIVIENSALGHNWDNDLADCEHGQLCLDCGAENPATGHHYLENTELATELTCTQNQAKHYACDICGDEYEEIITHCTGHVVTTWGEPTIEEGDEPCQYILTYEGECTVQGCCDNIVIKAETVYKHNYTAVIKTEATCMTKGEKTYTCSCGDTFDKEYEDSDAHVWNSGETVDGVTTYTCTLGCGETKTVVSAKQETETSVSNETIKEVGTVELKEATITLNGDTLSNRTGDVTISANKFDTETVPENVNLTPEQIEAIGDKPIYDFTMSDGSGSVSDFGQDQSGKKNTVTIKIPYVIEDEDPENIAVWYVLDNGEVESIQAVYSGGYLVFETTHFSIYTVTRLSPEERCALYGHSNKVDEILATCTTDGFRRETCIRCGFVNTVFTTAYGHDLEVTENTTATCSVDGRKVHSCKRENCDYEYVEKTFAGGHNWIENSKQDPTCVNAGHVIYKCDICNETYKNNVPAKGHSYTENTVQATCTTGGHTTYTCSECDHSYVGKYVDAKGHDYVHSTVSATCTTDGYDFHDCTVCDYSYKDNVVVGKHIWNIEQATCGEGQVCIICQANGQSATGEHDMESGVCTLCGQGCEHEFETTVVEATCNEVGYTLKECAKCDLSTKSDYVQALGHIGEFICTRCEEEMMQEGFFTNLSKNLVNEQFAFVIRDLEVSSEQLNYLLNADGEMEEIMLNTLNKLDFFELYIGTDSEDGIYAYGYGNMQFVTEGKDFFSEFEMIAKNGKIYLKDYSQDSYGLSTEAIKSFTIIKVEQAFMVDEGMNPLVAMSNWFSKSIAPILDKVIDTNSETLNVAIGKAFETLFDIEKTTTGYNMVFDFDCLKALNETLCTKTLSEMIDLAFGEGAYDNIDDLVASILDMTVADLITTLKGVGIEVEDLSKLVIGLFEMINGNADMLGDVNTPEKLTEAIKSYGEYKLGDIVSAMFNMSAEDLVMTVGGMLEEFRMINLYDMISRMMPNMTPTSIKEMVDDFIDMVAGKITITLKTNAEGKFSSFDVVVNDLSSFSASFNIVSGYKTQRQYDKLANEAQALQDKVVITYDKLKNAYGEENVQLLTEEGMEGYVQLTQSYPQGDYLEENVITGSELKVYRYKYLSKYTYILDPSVDVMGITEDCGNWYEVAIPLIFKDEQFLEIYYCETYDRATGLLKSTTVISEENKGYKEEYAGFGGGLDTLIVMYNMKSGTILNEESLHNYVLTKTVNAVGCTGLGERHYVCTSCQDSYIQYFVNGHGNNFEYTYEFLTQSESCDDGVICMKECKTCGTVLEEDIRYYHQGNLIETYNLQEYGAVCDSEMEYWACPCGYISELSMEYDESSCYFDHETVEYEDDYNYKAMNTCTVTNPEACGFRYFKESYTVHEGAQECAKRQYIRVSFGCDENGENAQKVVLIDCGLVYIHNYEWVESNEISCMFIEKCVDCDNVRNIDFVHDTDTTKFNPTANQETYKEECRNCDYVHEETSILSENEGSSVVSKSHVGYTTTHTFYNGENCVYVFKEELTSTCEVTTIAGYNYSDIKSSTGSVTFIYSTNGVNNVENNFAEYGETTFTKGQPVPVSVQYIYPDENGFDEMYLECGGRPYVPEVDGCKAIKIGQFENGMPYYSIHHYCDERWDFVQEQTCTQFGIERYWCARCGRIDIHNTYHNAPYEHAWERRETTDGEEYFECVDCGMLNKNGADGCVVLEDCTEEGSGILKAGYYIRDYGYDGQYEYEDEYVVNVSLILKNPEVGEDEVILATGVNIYSSLYGDGTYVWFEKSEATDFAQSLGLDEDEYYISLNFVPIGSGANLDYGLVFGMTMGN